MSGPLSELRIIEMVGIGPGPFAGMMLADAGAEVIAVERKGGTSMISHDINRRGKKSVILDLKSDSDKQQLIELVKTADALFEGFRPGVMEKLGLGPDTLLGHNPRLVYGRMTGWGQTGPLAHTAGHDLNYIALSGALHMMGDSDSPPPVPLNLVGDYGGGGMMLAFGLLAAIIEAKSSGKGQVVDASMVEGTLALSSLFTSLKASGLWSDKRGDNFLDGAAHFYGCYECADGAYIALAAIEPPFMIEFLTRMGMDTGLISMHMSKSDWPAMKQKIAELFKTQPRDHWAKLFDGTDACVTPVLSPNEALNHPHNVARQSFVDIDGITQPAPTPRFSRTESIIQHGPKKPGTDNTELLP